MHRLEFINGRPWILMRSYMRERYDLDIVPESYDVKDGLMNFDRRLIQDLLRCNSSVSLARVVYAISKEVLESQMRLNISWSNRFVPKPNNLFTSFSQDLLSSHKGKVTGIDRLELLLSPNEELKLEFAKSLKDFNGYADSFAIRLIDEFGTWKESASDEGVVGLFGLRWSKESDLLSDTNESVPLVFDYHDRYENIRDVKIMRSSLNTHHAEEVINISMLSQSHLFQFCLYRKENNEEGIPCIPHLLPEELKSETPSALLCLKSFKEGGGPVTVQIIWGYIDMKY
ncbi:hypothetical protein FACS189472_05840 [Alphaproteobacteria bacterium]|nr:hypothetical protein FACS189472_05840 [Alphaproteobacteria bacterium]